MAKIVFGPLISDARKKIGGVVFTKGRSGAFVRRKVSPIQPRTQAQMNVRANFTFLAKLWSDITMAAYRAAWNALAVSYPKKDKFGAAHSLTGMQFFLRLSRALHTIGISPILPPPASLVVNSLTSLTLDATAASHMVISGLVVTGDEAIYSYGSHTGVAPAVGMRVLVAGMTAPASNGVKVVIATTGGAAGSFIAQKGTEATDATAGTGDAVGLQLDFAATPLVAGDYLVVEATRQASAGRASSFPAPSIIQIIAPAATSPQSLLAAYVAKYGALISGRKIEVAAYIINSATGAASLKMTASSTVA